MTLYEYYEKLSKTQKRKMLQVVAQDCEIAESTVRSWVNKPGHPNLRDPQPLYKTHIARLLGIPREKLFPEKPEHQLPKN